MYFIDVLREGRILAFGKVLVLCIHQDRGISDFTVVQVIDILGDQHDIKQLILYAVLLELLDCLVTIVCLATFTVLDEVEVPLPDCFRVVREEVKSEYFSCIETTSVGFGPVAFGATDRWDPTS